MRQMTDGQEDGSKEAEAATDGGEGGGKGEGRKDSGGLYLSEKATHTSAANTHREGAYVYINVNTYVHVYLCV